MKTQDPPERVVECAGQLAEKYSAVEVGFMTPAGLLDVFELPAETVQGLEIGKSYQLSFAGSSDPNDPAEDGTLVSIVDTITGARYGVKAH